MGLGDLMVQKAYGSPKDNRNFNVSTDDVERLLEFQVDVMQRECAGGWGRGIGLMRGRNGVESAG